MAGKASQEVTLRDRKLLDGAANNFSGEELAQVSGMPAAQAIARVRELLKSRDVFDSMEKKKLLLHSVYKLKERIEDYDATVDLKNPKASEAYLRVLQAINDMLDKQGRISDEEMEQAARAQARQLLLLIEAAYTRARAWLEEEYVGLVNTAELDAVFQAALREIAVQED